MIARLIGLWLAALALAFAPASARAADGVAAAKTVRLPPLPADGAPPVLLAVEGRPLVLQRSAAYLLAADRSVWSKADSALLPSDATAAGGVSDGVSAVLLLAGKDGVDRASLVRIEGTALKSAMLPRLPVALKDARAAFLGLALVVAGRDAGGAVRLFRTPLQGGAGWTELPAWPGGGGLAALAGQGVALFAILEDGAHWRWTDKTGWKAREAAPGRIAPGSARPISQAGLLYLVDKDGSSRLYSYSAITDAWADLGHRQPEGAIANVRFGNGLLSAWQSDGRLEFAAAELEYQRRPLSTIDWGIIIAFLVLMLAMGGYFYRRSKHGSTSDFFLGSRAIPFWAAGISMFASNTSSISYLAIPAKAFETNWEYLMSKIVTVGGLIVVAVWIIPLFRRLNLVSVFNYLEMRFHPVIRMLSSALAILMHVGGRMGVVLFLPALAIGTITGTNVVLCIVLIGVCTLIYTALGGMRAVVWTDFFQIIVLMGGAFFAIGYIVYVVGAAPIFETAMQYDKTKLVNVSFDFTQPTIWGFLILILFDTVLTFPKDQVLMQRALSTPSEKQASRSVWVFAAILLPGGFVFYFIGSMLFAYYHAMPERLDPLLPIDAVFPAFIGTELPPGVAGLIIAGLFAAAMGSVSGTINSVATLLSVDFYEKIVRKPDQKKSVRFAEWMSVVVGLIGVGIAIILSRLDVHSLLDLTIELFGLLGGSCAGAYTLGMFTRRSNWQGVAIGTISASLITLACWIFGLVHPYFYLAIAIVMSIVVGYVASLFFPPPPAECLSGLTVFDGGGRKGRIGEPVPSTSIS
jgi:SSS family transporter